MQLSDNILNAPRDFLQLGNTAALLLERFIFRQGVQDVGLSQGQLHFLLLIVVGNNEVLYLDNCQWRATSPDKGSSYLVSPQENVALFALCASPYRE